MKLEAIFLISFNALRDRKVRSVLTILMVTVGSSLMIALYGLTAGLGNFIEGIFNKLAPNIIFVSSIPQGQQGPGQGPPSFLSQGLSSVPTTTLDSAVIDKIKSLPFVSDVIPAYQAPVIVESKNESKYGSVLSIEPQKLKIIAPALEFVEGSAVKPNDPNAIILAQDIANPIVSAGGKKLTTMPSLSSPPSGARTTGPFATLGQSINIKYLHIDPLSGERRESSKTFIVTGIIKPVGNPTIDKAIVINTEAGNALLHKSGRYDALFVVAASSNNVDNVEKEIRNVYGNDIGITTSKAILNTIKQFTNGFSAFISSIALISLLVGGVGIVTTMYTAVTERVREIGTMKALGAQSKIILGFFLVEAVIIGLLGASIGLLVGIGGSYFLIDLFASGGVGGAGQILSNITPVFLPTDLAFVWAISVGISITAGVYPAWKASRLSPITALRRE
jgi:putative ABC transport system permease protein